MSPKDNLAREQIEKLKRYLSVDLNLQLVTLPKLKNVYCTNNGKTIAIQYSKYFPKEAHYWFAINRRKFERIQSNEAFFLLICRDISLVYVFPTTYLRQMFHKIPQEKSIEKWAFNILTKHRLRLYGRKESKEDISNFINKFDFSLENLSEVPIKAYSQIDENIFHLPEELDNKKYWEGMATKINVNRYERDPDARKDCLKVHGFSCCVCDFNFEQIYGELGKGYIHVHHITPLSEIREGYQPNPHTDLIPVCPNCHAMIHSKRKTLSVDELKDLIIKRRV
jgi:hypothetical protein